MAKVDKLDELAHQINEALDDADYHFGEFDQSRVRAGRLLLEARDEVRAKYAHLNRRSMWQDWCHENIKTRAGKPRTYRDCQKCMALALADNPAVAVEAERAKAKIGMRKTRAKQREAANVSRPARRSSQPDIIKPSQPAPAQPARVGKDDLQTLRDQCFAAYQNWIVDASPDEIRRMMDFMAELKRGRLAAAS